jgi:hypothetical protein
MLMTKNQYKEIYFSYLDKIKNKIIRDFTKQCTDILPEFFWTEYASSSGKYHGGNDLRIEHVIDCLKLADRVIRQRQELGEWQGDEPDQLISAIMLHDGWTCTENSQKYTQEDVDNGKCLPDRIGRCMTEKNHAEIACRECGRKSCTYSSKYFSSFEIDLIFTAIRYHAGPWTPNMTSLDKDWFRNLPSSSVVYQTHNIDYAQSSFAAIGRS